MKQFNTIAMVLAVVLAVCTQTSLALPNWLSFFRREPVYEFVKVDFVKNEKVCVQRKEDYSDCMDCCLSHGYGHEYVSYELHAYCYCYKKGEDYVRDDDFGVWITEKHRVA